MDGPDRHVNQGLRRRLHRAARRNLRRRLENNLIEQRVEAALNASSSSSSEGEVDDGGIAIDVLGPPPGDVDDDASEESNPDSDSDSIDAESNPEPMTDGDSDGIDAESDPEPINDSDSDGGANHNIDNLNDEEREEYLLDNLRDWGLRGITKTKVDDMLRILRPLHPFLPKSSKTLLKTPRSTEFVDIGESGKLWYKGIAANIPQNLPENYFVEHNELVLDVSMDGLQIHESSDREFWPILGCFQGCSEPFIIAVHFGVGKPEDLDLFLDPYVQELANLQANGYSHQGVLFPVRVRHYILDAVARAFIKQCIGHGGYFACEKCTIRGRWYMGRMTFAGGDHPLRTDDSFRARLTPHHHNGISPLENLGTGMVSQFRLDAMHLVYLGVVKRMLSFLFFRRSNVRLAPGTVEAINDFMTGISLSFPSEFNRLPRNFGNEERKTKLKATEYRRFALYDCVVALKDHVQPAIYRCFLLLHCALYILCSTEMFERMNDVAEYLLGEFVNLAEEVFGTEFVTYNVHSLKHLSQESRDCHAPLDSFSAFKFENYMKTIKQTLKTPVKPLQQLARRDAEAHGKLLRPKEPVNNHLVKLKKRRNPERVEAFQGHQYEHLCMKGFTLSSKQGNNCFSTRNNDIIFLSNIIRSADRGILLAGRKFIRKENFYDFPMESSVLGIFCVSELERRRRYWKLRHIKCKNVAIPYGQTFVCFPLVHMN